MTAKIIDLASRRPKDKTRMRKGPPRGTVRGLNLYIDPIPGNREQLVDRGMLHGLLSAYGWGDLTVGLTRQLFENGGVHKIRCDQERAIEVKSMIARKLPTIQARIVRTSRLAA